MPPTTKKTELSFKKPKAKAPSKKPKAEASKKPKNKAQSKKPKAKVLSNKSGKEPNCTNQFCEKIFLPARVAVEEQIAKDQGTKYAPSKELQKILTRAYLDNCKEIYCRPSCGWAKTVKEERQHRLQRQGAQSACRDLLKDYPKGYKIVKALI